MSSAFELVYVNEGHLRMPRSPSFTGWNWLLRCAQAGADAEQKRTPGRRQR